MQAKYPNGDVYAGSHKQGIKNGKGTYIYKETNVIYNGEWKDNKKEGKGEMIFQNENNAILTGVFSDDDMCLGEFKDSVGNLFKSKKHPDKAS